MSYNEYQPRHGAHFASRGSSVASDGYDTTSTTDTRPVGVHMRSRVERSDAGPTMDESVHASRIGSRFAPSASRSTVNVMGSQDGEVGGGAANGPSGSRHGGMSGAAPGATLNDARRKSSYSSYDEHSHGHRHGHRHHGDWDKQRKKPWRIAAAVVAGVIALVLVVGGVCGFMLYRDARTMASRVPAIMGMMADVKDSVLSGDADQTRALAGEIADQTAELHTMTDSAPWQFASLLPVVGEDVQSARTMVAELDGVCRDALVPVCDKLAGIKLSDLLSDGAINVSLLEDVTSTLAEVEPVVSDSARVIDNLPDAHIDQLNTAMAKVKDLMGTASAALSTASDISPYLPQMLGADGQTRSYLIIAENNVEIRANGGFGGSQGVITLTDGVMSIGDFTSATVLSEDEALAVTDEEQLLFNGITQHMGTNSGDALFTPDFPRAASLVAQMWEIENGQHVDGVIALDPVFLQYVLGVVGGVSLPDGTSVDGSNAATVLMHDVYWNYPASETDAIFASVAQATFDKLLSGLGDVDLAQLVSAVQRGCSEGRFIAWMEDESEESAVKKAGIAAALPDADDISSVPIAGVFLNSYGTSKLDWYLDFETSTSFAAARADGTAVYDVTVRLRNSLEEEGGYSLPDYVAANVIEDGNRLRDDERLGVYLYAPAGGTIENVQTSGSAPLALQAATHDGLNLLYGVVDMRAQQDCTITYTITVPAEAQGELVIRSTPTAQAAREGSIG